MNKLKSFWGKLTPAGKKRLIWIILFVVFVIFTAIAYFLSGRHKSNDTSSMFKQERVSIQDKKILEVSEKANYQAIIEQQRILMEKLRNKEITEEEFNAEMAKLGGLPKEGTPQSPQAHNQLSTEAKLTEKALAPNMLGKNETSITPFSEEHVSRADKDHKAILSKNSTRKVEVDDAPESFVPTPTPPPPPPMNTSLPPSFPDQMPSNLPEAKKVQIELIGDIGVVSATAKDKKDTEKDSKKKASIYLPSSFMEATLLSGLDAPTVESAKGNPMLTLLRIKDLAILPNKVKANLKGCFAVAEGYGNLADERAHLRLVSISCIDKKGQSIIDQKVKGYVVDSDGKVGLRGKVVAKMGSMIARAFMAGFLGGFGDAIRSSSTTNIISPLGTTSTINTDQALKAGLGAGIAQSALELQRFYMELARQTMPVIEIGATRSVTLVISEGVSLELKNINLDKEMEQ